MTRSETQVQPHAEDDRRVDIGLNSVLDLHVERELGRRGDRQIVEGFHALRPILDAERSAEAALLEARVIIADAIHIVVASGNEAAATDAGAKRPLNRIGVLIGEPGPRKQADAFMIGLAVHHVDGLVVRVRNKQILPTAPVNRPRAVLLGNSQSLARLKDQLPADFGEILVEGPKSTDVHSTGQLAKAILNIQFRVQAETVAEVVESGGRG